MLEKTLGTFNTSVEVIVLLIYKTVIFALVIISITVINNIVLRTKLRIILGKKI